MYSKRLRNKCCSACFRNLFCIFGELCLSNVGLMPEIELKGSRDVNALISDAQMAYNQRKGRKKIPESDRPEIE